MAVTDRYAGSSLYVSFAGSAVNSSFRNFTVKHSQDDIDSSAGAQLYKSRVSGMRDLEWTLEYLDEGTVNSMGSVLNIGNTGTLLYGPEGTASGKHKGGFLGIVTGVDEAYPYDGVVTRTVSGKIAGGSLLFNVNSDAWGA